MMAFNGIWAGGLSQPQQMAVLCMMIPQALTKLIQTRLTIMNLDSAQMTERSLRLTLTRLR